MFKLMHFHVLLSRLLLACKTLLVDLGAKSLLWHMKAAHEWSLSLPITHAIK